MKKKILIFEFILFVCCYSENLGEKLDIKNTCGKINPGGVGFLIKEKSHESPYGEIPWMIAVFHKKKVGEEKKDQLVCGGSLIHPQVVMTASYCVGRVNISDITVRAGEWDLENKNELFMEQDRQITEIIQYNKTISNNLISYDIALLITNKPFDLNEIVKTVCLPSLKMNFNNNNNNCFVNGWGKTVTDELAVILKKIKFNIITTNDCEEKLKDTAGKKFLPINEKYICAEVNDVGIIANRDGGGPFNCPLSEENERYYQAGVVSWGPNKNLKLPEGFNNVAFYREWIDSIMESKNFDRSYYTV